MPVTRVAPDAILEQTNLTGNVLVIDEDPDAPDLGWLTAQSNNADSIVRVSFPTPDGELSGTQEFRARVRKMGGSGTPTAQIEVWEGGVLRETGSSVGVTSTSGVVISHSWDPSLVGSDGSAVELRVVGAKSGGSPSSRAAIEVGAVEWNAAYLVSAITGSVAVAAGATVAAAGRRTLRSSAAVSATASAAITAKRILRTSVSAVVTATVTIAGAVGGTIQGAAAVAASATVAATGAVRRTGSAIVNSSAAVAIAGAVKRTASATVSGAATVAVAGRRILRSAVAITGSATVSARGPTTEVTAHGCNPNSRRSQSVVLGRKGKGSLHLG